MRFSDAATGAVLIGVALAVVLATLSFPEMPGQNYGPAFFPRILGAGLAGCGLLLVGGGIREGTARPVIALDAWARSARGLGTLALTIGAIVFYILASEPLGFIPTAFAAVAALMIRLRGRWASSLVIAAVTTLVLHRFFYGLLLVPLPWGVLEPLVF